MKKTISLKKLQKYVESNEKPRKKKEYFLKLIEEVGELSEMINKDKRLDPDDARTKAIKGTMEEELADVLFYLIGLANAYEIDLGEAFLRKRKYEDKKNDSKNGDKTEKKSEE